MQSYSTIIIIIIIIIVYTSSLWLVNASLYTHKMFEDKCTGS